MPAHASFIYKSKKFKEMVLDNYIQPSDRRHNIHANLQPLCT